MKAAVIFAEVRGVQDIDALTQQGIAREMESRRSIGTAQDIGPIEPGS